MKELSEFEKVKCFNQVRAVVIEKFLDIVELELKKKRDKEKDKNGGDPGDQDDDKDKKENEEKKDFNNMLIDDILTNDAYMLYEENKALF